MRKKITTLLIGLLASATLFAGPTDDLFDAIKKYDLNKMKAAIEAGADVNAYDALGNTPILNAIYFEDMVKELIAAKCDVNKFNKTNMYTPLGSACSYGTTGTILALLDAGADVNAKDAFMGITPFFSAFNYGVSVEAINEMIKKGANTKHVTIAGNNLMEFFAAGGQSPQVLAEKMKEVVKYLQSQGGAIPERLQNPSLNQWSSLEERFNIITNMGFDVNAETPYTAPITNPNAAEINKTNAKFGLKTFPLFMVMTNYGSRAEMVKLFVSKGADVNKKFGSGNFGLNRSLLHVVALQGDKVSPNDKADLVKSLVDSGIDINATDGPGFTATMYAAQNGNTSFIKAILPFKPDLNVLQKEVSNDAWTSYQSTTYVTKKTYRTARDWAAEGKHTEVYNLINAAGGKGASELK